MATIRIKTYFRSIVSPFVSMCALSVSRPILDTPEFETKKEREKTEKIQREKCDSHNLLGNVQNDNNLLAFPFGQALFRSFFFLSKWVLCDPKRHIDQHVSVSTTKNLVNRSIFVCNADAIETEREKNAKRIFSLEFESLKINEWQPHTLCDKHLIGFAENIRRPNRIEECEFASPSQRERSILLNVQAILSLWTLPSKISDYLIPTYMRLEKSCWWRLFVCGLISCSRSFSFVSCLRNTKMYLYVPWNIRNKSSLRKKK